MWDCITRVFLPAQYSCLTVAKQLWLGEACGPASFLQSIPCAFLMSRIIVLGILESATLLSPSIHFKTCFRKLFKPFLTSLIVFTSISLCGNMYTTLQTGILLLSILNQFRLGPSVPHSHTEMDTMGSYATALALGIFKCDFSNDRQAKSRVFIQ